MKNPPELVRLYNLSRAAFDQKEYDRAIGLAERYLDKVEEDAWALGMIHACLREKLKRARSKKSKAELQARTDEIETRMAAKGEDSEVWLDQFSRAYALNGQAWSQYEAARSKKALNAALKTIDKAMTFTPYQFGYQDTRIRILLKLGREDEAYTTARWIIALMPDHVDMQDIKKDKSYKAWLKQHKADPVKLPDGLATLEQVIPQPDEPLPDTGQRLTAAQRNLLLSARVGQDEWHRARNVALVVVLNNTELGLDELLEKKWPETNLSQGTIDISNRDTLSIDDSSTLALRHHMLIDTNHRLFLKNHENKLQIFKTFKFDKLKPADGAEILQSIGEAVGIDGLTAERFQRSRFQRFGGGMIGKLDDRKQWNKVEATGADIDGLAEVISWPSRYDSWYVLYTIEVDGIEYGFVFETDCDELHRGFSNGPAMWYDPLVSGECFAVRYCKDDPRRHLVTDERFGKINGRARFVGKASKEVKEFEDLEF